ncbi:MAG: hypothetical protein ABRQ38_03845 [Candidatus Eremiobacterota bacterium]
MNPFIKHIIPDIKMKAAKKAVLTSTCIDIITVINIENEIVNIFMILIMEMYFLKELFLIEFIIRNVIINIIIREKTG